MFFCELQRVKNSQSLVDIAAKWQIVDNLVTYYTFPVDQKQSSQGYPGIEQYFV
jgi:hypothetical protein